MLYITGFADGNMDGDEWSPQCKQEKYNQAWGLHPAPNTFLG